jgi:hypothetical protein
MNTVDCNTLLVASGSKVVVITGSLNGNTVARQARYFPNESFSPMVRLNTSAPGLESTLSAQK